MLAMLREMYAWGSHHHFFPPIPSTKEHQSGKMMSLLWQVLAACKLAKQEVIWYCQHAAQVSVSERLVVLYSGLA